MNFNLVIEADCWGEKNASLNNHHSKKRDEKESMADPPLQLCLSPFRSIFAFKSRNN